MSCKDKTRYKSSTSAYMAGARVLKSTEYKYMRAYICPHCHHWHLTTQVKKEIIT